MAAKKKKKAAKKKAKGFAMGDPVDKVRAIVAPNGDPFKAQNVLRKMRYFARAVSMTKIATNAPPKALKSL